MKAWWPPGHIIGWDHTFTHTVFDLIESIANGTPVSPSFEDGVRNQRVIDAIEHAAQTRAWVAVNRVVKPNELPLPLGLAVITLPLESQLTDAFQVELIFWGGVMVTVTIQLLAPVTLTVVL